jgi:hypothetical protein
MKTIETRATVRPDGTLVATVPADVAPGEHRVVLVLEEVVVTANTGALDQAVRSNR